MDLHTGYPFWPAKDGLIRTYDPLDASFATDVVVIGGGITGALITHALVEAGIECVVLDGRNIGWGSTSASTALLQYEIDTHLVDLIGMVGPEQGVLAYRSCRDAMRTIEGICRDLDAGHFAWRRSFYFASLPNDVEPLRTEFETRREHGFDVEWLDADAIASTFDLKSDAGILSQSAEVDCFHLTHALFHHAAQRETRIFARTKVREIVEKDERVLVHTERGPSLDCRCVVVACGYESLSLLKKPPKVDLNSSYALVSEPVKSFDGWPDRCLIWETARPYRYARTTDDGRGLLGGEDLPFRNPAARDAARPHQIARLEAAWKELFPRIPLETAYDWTGTFAETKDGLPFIGIPKEQPRTFFALCYGGNGIVFGALAGEMAVAAIRGTPHPCEALFAFDRPSAR